MNIPLLKSPLKNAPSCWEDDKRMTALYSPFRGREINPLDYDTKMKFWYNNILELCFEKNDCVFSIRKIQEEFRRKERLPLGLRTVIENLERDKLIREKDDFLKVDPNETWTEWAVKSLVKTPAIWSFTKLKMALTEIDGNNVEYISIEFLKKKNEDVLSKTSGCTKLFNMSDIKSMLTTIDGIEITEESFKILLKWMQMQKSVQIKYLESDTLIKFCHGMENPINDIDISLYIIEKNKISFEKAVQVLEDEKYQLISTAKSYLKKDMRDMAKSYLRRKNEVEKTIAKRVSVLENIELLLSRIQDTSADSKVFETYKIALNALKRSFKENGLSEDEVTNTVTEMQEINEMHEEIQNALAEPLSTCDTDLEDELMKILESDKQNEGLVLPEVPTQRPTGMKETRYQNLEPALS